MGLKDLFSGFSADARKQKAFDKMVSKLVSRNYQSEDRMFVIESLANMENPKATAALFRRYDMTSDKKREDIAEKEYLSDVLASKGDTMLSQLRAHNDKSANVTLPIQLMKRVASPEEVVTELIRVLRTEQARLASFRPQKKLRLIELIADFPEDPRLTEALLPGVEDFDADVRFETARLLGHIGNEQIRDALVDRYCNPEEDSLRVKQAILIALHERGCKVVDRKDDLGDLGEDWRIGPKGTLIKAD